MSENEDFQPAITNIEFDNGVITVNANFTMAFPGDNDFEVPCLINFVHNDDEPVGFDVGLHRVSAELLAVFHEAVDYCRDDLDAYLASKQPKPVTGDSEGDEAQGEVVAG